MSNSICIPFASDADLTFVLLFSNHCGLHEWFFMQRRSVQPRSLWQVGSHNGAGAHG
jgi:hypothetical protein